MADGAKFAFGAGNSLFETRVYRPILRAMLPADSRRFITCYEPGQPNVVIVLVENWDAETKKK